MVPAENNGANPKLDFFEIIVLIAAVALTGYGSAELYRSNRGTQGPAAGKTLARLTHHERDVFIKTNGSFVWRAVAPGESFSDGDSLKTGGNSSARVLFGAKELKVHASSLIVFRSGQNAGPPVELVFGQADGQIVPAKPSPVMKTAVQSEKRAQELWWISPEGDRLPVDENDSQFKITWGATWRENFQVTLSGGESPPQETSTSKFEAQFELPPPGTYTLEIRSSGKILRKNIRIVSLAPPAWLARGESGAAKISLRWSSRAAGETEIEVRDEKSVVFRDKTNLNEIVLDGEKLKAGKNQVLAARLRTVHADGDTGWSAPYPFQFGRQLKTFMNGLLEPNVVLRGGMNGKSECLAPARWKLPTVSAGERLTLSVRAPHGDQDVNLTAASPTFCPSEPGEFFVQLRKSDADGTVTAVSEELQLKAALESPKFAPGALRAAGDGKFQLLLDRPMLFPLAAEVENAKGERRTVALKSFNDPLALAAGDKKLRLKYGEPSNPELSSWSEFADIPTPQAPPPLRVPAENIVEELKIKAIDSGPTLSSGSSKMIWAELHWSTNVKALRYEVEISTDGQFAGEQQSRQVKSNKLFLPFETMKNFFWRARAVSKEGVPGPWTKTIAATVQSVNPKDPSASTQSTPRLDRREERAPSGAGSKRP